jgi:hypothetical protein
VFSRRQQTIWIFAVIALLVPHLGLMAVGGYALWKNGWFWLYGGVTAGITALVYGLAVYLRGRRGLQEVAPLQFECPESWPPREREAWRKVERLAEQAIQGEIPTKNIDDLRNLLERLIREIALHYHPDHEDAYLDIPLPQLLKIVEKVTQDLRQVVQQYVPGSHILTLRDWVKLKQAYDFVQPLYKTSYMAYRIATVPISPLNALWREIRGYVTGQVIDLSLGELRSGLASYVVHRMGFYLIELYSGRVVLDEVEFDRVCQTAEQAELRAAQSDVDDSFPEFIRIVIVGQLKTGKSSLVNALRRTWHARSDVLPCTNNVQCYLMKPSTDDLGNGFQPLPGLLMLVDTPGYDSLGEDQAFQSSFEEIKKADLILLICSARMASRRADREFSQRVRRFFQEHPHWKMPPVIVVGSFIDELRPRHEWNPPYQWEPTGKRETLSPKEKSLQGFLNAIRSDLELSPHDSVIPVCTHPDRVWNVAEALIPAIAAYWDEARGVRENRHLHSYQGQKYRHLWRQTVNLIGGTARLAFKRIGLK